MTAPDTGAGRDAGDPRDDSGDRDEPAASEAGQGEAVQGGAALLPEQSREDTDAAWGEYPAESADDQYYRDRPPHWDNY